MTRWSALGWGWRTQRRAPIPVGLLRTGIQAGATVAVLKAVAPQRMMVLAGAAILLSLVSAGVASARALVSPAFAWAAGLGAVPLYSLAAGSALRVTLQRRLGVVLAAAAAAANGGVQVVPVMLAVAATPAAGFAGCAAAALAVRAWLANRAGGVVVVATMATVSLGLSRVPGLLAAVLIVVACVAARSSTLDAVSGRVATGWPDQAVERQTPAMLAPVVHHLQRRRSLAAALLWKGVISRSRIATSAMRLAVVAVVAAGYAAVSRKWPIPPGSLNVFALVVAGGVIADGAPSPFGAEGARIVLLRTSPHSRRRLVLAKVASHGVPAAAIAVAAVTLAAAAGGVLHQLLPALGVAVGFAFAAAALATVISLFDADPSAQPRTRFEAVVLEELPVTPARVLTVHAIAAAGLALAALVR